MVTNERGDATYADEPAVFLGDIIEATAANAGNDKFDSQTDVTIDMGLESISFHTSCSKPLAVGDQFGSVRVVEVVSTEGGVVTLPDVDLENPEGSKECVIPPPPAPPHCEGKVKGISLTYLGGSCAESNNPQEGKATCSGSTGAAPVSVVVVKDPSKASASPTSGIQTGDMVAIDGGGGDLGSETKLDIIGASGTESLAIHTSCSKPLAVGDQFGSLLLTGFTPKP